MGVLVAYFVIILHNKECGHIVNIFHHLLTFYSNSVKARWKR